MVALIVFKTGLESQLDKFLKSFPKEDGQHFPLMGKTSPPTLWLSMGDFTKLTPTQQKFISANINILVETYLIDDEVMKNTTFADLCQEYGIKL